MFLLPTEVYTKFHFNVIIVSVRACERACVRACVRVCVDSINVSRHKQYALVDIVYRRRTTMQRSTSADSSWVVSGLDES